MSEERRIMRELLESAERYFDLAWAAFDASELKCEKCVNQGFCQSYHDSPNQEGDIDPSWCTGGKVIIAYDNLKEDDFHSEMKSDSDSAIQRARKYLYGEQQ